MYLFENTYLCISYVHSQMLFPVGNLMAKYWSELRILELGNGDNFQIFICLDLFVYLNLSQVIRKKYFNFFMTNQQKNLRRLLISLTYQHLARGSAILYSLLSNDAARLDRKLAVMLGRINWSLWNKIASRRQNMFSSFFSA